MRVCILDTVYAGFLDRLLAEEPELADAPYAEQLDRLMARSFGTSDAYSVNLRALGHEAVEIVANAEPLQRAWARENGAARLVRLLERHGRSRPREWARQRLLPQIAMAQIEAFDPDVVYCQDLSFLPLDALAALRRSGRLVAGQIASPPPPPERLAAYDLLLTSFPHFVERFRALGVDSEYLAIAFDERILERVPTPPERSGIAFVGGLDPRVHGEGVEMLDRLLAAGLEIEVHGYGGELLPGGSRVRAAWRGPAWGLEMYAVLGRCAIALNRHIAAAEGHANNMRLFEATGMGALLVTETAPNLGELFDPGREVATYDGVDTLIDVLRRYGDDADSRRAIAEAGQARTLADHSYRRRMEQLVPILEARL